MWPWLKRGLEKFYSNLIRHVLGVSCIQCHQHMTTNQTPEPNQRHPYPPSPYWICGGLMGSWLNGDLVIFQSDLIKHVLKA